MCFVSPFAWPGCSAEGCGTLELNRRWLEPPGQSSSPVQRDFLFIVFECIHEYMVPVR